MSCLLPPPSTRPTRRHLGCGCAAQSCVLWCLSRSPVALPSQASLPLHRLACYGGEGRAGRSLSVVVGQVPWHSRHGKQMHRPAASTKSSAGEQAQVVRPARDVPAAAMPLILCTPSGGTGPHTRPLGGAAAADVCPLVQLLAAVQQPGHAVGPRFWTLQLWPSSSQRHKAPCTGRRRWRGGSGGVPPALPHTHVPPRAPLHWPRVVRVSSLWLAHMPQGCSVPECQCEL